MLPLCFARLEFKVSGLQRTTFFLLAVYRLIHSYYVSHFNLKPFTSGIHMYSRMFFQQNAQLYILHQSTAIFSSGLHYAAHDFLSSQVGNQPMVVVVTFVFEHFNITIPCKIQLLCNCTLFAALYTLFATVFFVNSCCHQNIFNKCFYPQLCCFLDTIVTQICDWRKPFRCLHLHRRRTIYQNLMVMLLSYFYPSFTFHQIYLHYFFFLARFP